MERPPLRLDAAGERLRLLHVHAHPDDESSKGAASTAKYVAEGVEVMVATCTGGERGSILNPAMDRPDILANIGEIRRAEMDRARSILGIEQVWLGFVDSGLPEGDPLPPLPDGCFASVDLDVAVGRLVEVIRRFRPQVMTTYDENGGYPHPDHIRCHEISVAAYDAAADPDRYPDAGEPWQVAKLYYHLSFHWQRFAALNHAMIEAGLESPYAERLATWERKPEDEKRLTTRVECSGYFAVRDQALLAHATQIDPEGPWFSVPLEIHQRAWPSEDYQLVRSTVDSGSPRTTCSPVSLSPRPRPWSPSRVGFGHDVAGGRPQSGPAGVDAARGHRAPRHRAVLPRPQHDEAVPADRCAGRPRGRSGDPTDPAAPAAESSTERTPPIPDLRASTPDSGRAAPPEQH